MAKYAMIGKAKPIPQNSRNTVCDAIDCLQDDLVTSRAILVECKIYADAEWPRADIRRGQSHVRALQDAAPVKIFFRQSQICELATSSA